MAAAPKTTSAPAPASGTKAGAPPTQTTLGVGPVPEEGSAPGGSEVAPPGAQAPVAPPAPVVAPAPPPPAPRASVPLAPPAVVAPAPPPVEEAPPPPAQVFPLAATKLGPAAPEMPPEPPPSAPVKVTGKNFSDDEAPRPARVLVNMPLIGATLRCDNFGEAGEGLAVQAEVKDTDEDDGSVLLWIAALSRRWVIGAARITRGDRWVHHVEDYPPPGVDRRFDARFRQKGKSVADVPAPPPVEAKKFTPPRPARPGFVWVELIAHSVMAIGFDLAGKSNKRWMKGDQAEVVASAVNPAPKLFKRL